MNKINKILICLFILTLISCSKLNQLSTEQKDNILGNPYPFFAQQDEQFTVSASIESKELFEKYNPLFVKYGLSGNGYSWDGVITQILQKENPLLLKVIDFDSEAGGFYVYTNSKDAQTEFLITLCPIFNDLKLLESYFKSLDRTSVDD